MTASFLFPLLYYYYYLKDHTGIVYKQYCDNKRHETSRIKYSIEKKIDEIEGKTPENDMQTDKEKKMYDLHICIEKVYIYM